MKPIDYGDPKRRTVDAHAAKSMAALLAGHERLKTALTDMLGGWRYIRQAHGDLYGVGWDRAQKLAEDALKEAL